LAFLVIFETKRSLKGSALFVVESNKTGENGEMRELVFSNSFSSLGGATEGGKEVRAIGLTGDLSVSEICSM
jgi:hypothetical protein